MRLGLEDVPTPHPMLGMLPAMLQEDAFATALASGLDSVLAPLISALDCVDAYIDTDLSPEDFLTWLSHWVGVNLDENWPLNYRRAFVKRGVELFRVRGTVTGLAALLETVTGGSVQIAETGGVAVSNAANGPLPGEPQPRMTVRIIVDDPATVNERAIDAFIAESKPAYVIHKVEVVSR